VPTPLSEILALGTAQLSDAGVADALVDTELLAGFALGMSRGSVQAGAATGRVIDDEQVENIQTLFDRRAKREPLQHITGRAPFRHLELRVGPGVFVPRPETEWVTQIALDELHASHEPERDGAPVRVVDLCTGSGAIALAVASERPTVTVWGVEKSEAAFAWAQKNVAALGVSNVSLDLADAANALPELEGSVSVVISNPPYIPRSAVPRDAEVHLFDPELALYGGDDGLDVVRSVSKTAFRLLKPGGLVVIEHGEFQAGEIQAILTADGFADVRSHQDFTERDRATTARR
jgi:release factor glutamine methyltransferase